jgi:hypothetical protein
MPSLSSYGWTDYYYSSNRENPRGVVTMAFSFKNSEKDGLGDALPAGALRIYGSDKSGAKRYLGASDVWNAPKDAKVDVTLANAFDLYTMRKVAASKKINKRTVRKTIEIVVHNAKPAAADVVVVQGFNGKWKIADENVKHVNADASTVKWTVRVPAASEQTLKFSVDLS